MLRAFKFSRSDTLPVKSLELVIEHTAETIHPMHAFVCDSPAVEREVLLEGKPGDETRTLLFYVEGDPDAYEAALEARNDSGEHGTDEHGGGERGTNERDVEYDVRRDGDDGFFVYVREPNAEREAPLLDAFRRDTVVVVPPVEFRADRTMRLTAVGHSDDLRELLDALPDALDADVLSVGPFARGMGSTLTDRQREALGAAWRVGYYEVPRGGDVEAVAAELDCGVSNASTLLRRAEAGLVADALGEHH